MHYTKPPVLDILSRGVAHYYKREQGFNLAGDNRVTLPLAQIIRFRRSCGIIIRGFSKVQFFNLLANIASVRVKDLKVWGWAVISGLFKKYYKYFLRQEIVPYFIGLLNIVPSEKMTHIICWIMSQMSSKIYERLKM